MKVVKPVLPLGLARLATQVLIHLGKNVSNIPTAGSLVPGQHAVLHAFRPETCIAAVMMASQWATPSAQDLCPVTRKVAMAAVAAMYGRLARGVDALLDANRAAQYSVKITVVPQ